MGLRLATFIRERSETIIDRWEREIRQERRARELTRAQRLNDFGRLVAQLAAYAEPEAGTPAALPREVLAGHALNRLAFGFDTPEIVGEYATLREVIVAQWEEEVGRTIDAADVRALNRAMDEAIGISVSRFAESRMRAMRAMRALDRVALAALDRKHEQADLGATLLSLCRAFAETTESADCATIYLCDGNDLVARASVGLEAEVENAFRVAAGDGFAGRVAAGRAPLLFPAAATDPRVVSPYVRAKGIRALYGVPMIEADEVIGVAHMASCTVSDFSEEDKLIFRGLAARATSVVARAQLEVQLHDQMTEARRLAEERGALLTEAERRAAELDAIITSIPEAIYIGDASGITRANRLGLEMLGVESLESLQKEIPELADRIQVRSIETGELIPSGELVFTRALQGEAAMSEVRHLNLKTGRELAVRSSAAPIHVGGRVVGAVAVNVDITAQKRQEHETRRRMQFEEQLIGIVSHDLRTPIATVILTAQALLRQNRLDERQTTAIVRLLNAGERANRMVDDLLDFTKARHSGIPIRRAPMNLHALVRRIGEEVALGYPHRHLSIASEGDGDGTWDGDRLAQVIANLTRNAFTYSPGGTDVELRTRGDGDTVVLEVANGGSPIPPESLGRIFEPMQRATDSGREGRNIGLGLYIVRAIVEAHGGSITVRSDAGHGTTFTIRLPRRA